MAAVSILLILVVSVIVGGLTGSVLGSESTIWVAIVSGLLAVIMSNVVRNIAMVRGLRLGPDDRRVPNLVIVFAAISSLAGKHDRAGNHANCDTAFTSDLGDAVRTYIRAPHGDVDDHLSHESRSPKKSDARMTATPDTTLQLS